MKSRPLVSIICTVYNQVEFVEECLESVFAQSYPHIELILIDNGSEDGSTEVLHKWLKREKQILPLFCIQA